MGLGIREARNTLPSLIRRAAEGDEEIQLGPRGTDEVTLVATHKYQRMSHELDHLRTEIAQLREQLAQMSQRADRLAGSGQPFAGLQRALESGRLSVGTSGPRIREYMPDYLHSSEVGREERVRFGSRTPEPQYHRPGPRA
jgi:antitoxin (DNA-binding transcriptional repressor) of toxin-antitoxin stability system